MAKPIKGRWPENTGRCWSVPTVEPQERRDGRGGRLGPERGGRGARRKDEQESRRGGAESRLEGRRVREASAPSLLGPAI